MCVRMHIQTLTLMHTHKTHTYKDMYIYKSMINTALNFSLSQ